MYGRGLAKATLAFRFSFYKSTGGKSESFARQMVDKTKGSRIDEASNQDRRKFGLFERSFQVPDARPEQSFDVPCSHGGVSRAII